jgi:hypothetical protein
MVMRIITVRTPYRYLSVVTVPVPVRTIAYIYSRRVALVVADTGWTRET